ncbi:hypothetical protein [Paenibacillus cymbidii]|uniref:hypothetical protein n=1 Tax=Paenibacillus cymbidii TaxID=1639034 RepID=UPI001A9B7962|nr:hypothetical protein [Paenibacillus cymbidii]
MKKSKWRKWQIGAVATLGAAFLFREVQTSPEFAQAVAKESGSGDVTALQRHDPVTEELRGGANGATGTGQTPGAGGGRRTERAGSGSDSSGSGGGTGSGSTGSGSTGSGSTGGNGSYGNGGSGQTVQPQPTQAPSTRMQARTRRS